MKVLITSKNHTKVSVTKKVFRKIFPNEKIGASIRVLASD